MSFSDSPLKYTSTSFVTILVACIFTYSGIGNHDFLYWDDIDHIVHNRHLTSISLDNLIWIFTSLNQIMWHPITSLSHMFTFSLFGENALPFKILNIAIHISNSFLVYLISYKILSRLNQNEIIFKHHKLTNRKLAASSFFASLTFALHPIHTESIVWVIERKDLLCALFYFLGIITYIKSTETDNNTAWRHATLIFYVLALSSKPMAITFPLILIFMDLFVFQTKHINKPWRKVITTSAIDKVVMLGITLCFSIVTLLTQKSAIQDLNELGFIHRSANIIESLYHYLINIFFPFNISPYYPLPDYSAYPLPLFILGFIVFLSFLYILIRLYMHGTQFPALMFIYFIITILPVIGIIKVGHAAFADRYTYIPSLSVHIFVGATLGSLLFCTMNKHLKSLFGVFIFIYISSLAFTSKSYTVYWANDEQLWAKVIDLYPYKSDVAYLNYGNAAFRKNGCKNALPFYHLSLALKPTQIEALRNLAKCQKFIGNQVLASHYYKLLAKRNPDSSLANLLAGDYFYNNKELPKAELYYRAALQADPGNTDAIFKNAVIDYVTLKNENALTKITYILQLEPKHLGALQLKTKIEYEAGNFSQSLIFAKKVLAINPKDKFANHVIESLNKDMDS